MSGDQIPSLPIKKRRQMPEVCPGGMLKIRFDWYISTVIYEMRGGRERGGGGGGEEALILFFPNRGLT